MTRSSDPSVPPELSHPRPASLPPTPTPSITLQQLSPLLVHAVLMLCVASNALFVLASGNPRAWSPNEDTGWAG